MRAINIVKATLWVALFAVAAVAAKKNVAVVETEVDPGSGAANEVKPADVRQVTDELRRRAVKSLPKETYNVMTSETVYSQLGSEKLGECADENCVIALGSKIGADFIVKGIISKLGPRFTLAVEIYETEDGNLVASSEPVRSEKFENLVEDARKACEDMYNEFVNEHSPAQKPAAVAAGRQSESKSAPAAKKQPSVPAAKAEQAAQLPKSAQALQSYTLTVKISPADGGSVFRTPDRAAYASGAYVALIATPRKGYKFVGWTGIETASEPDFVSIKMDANKELTANFEIVEAEKVRPSATLLHPDAVAASKFTFTDSRDNKTYGAVKFGNQVWMTENLNYKTSNGSWCYGNRESSCAQYGRLYDWETAAAVCPSGWRLPFHHEWNDLVTAVGGSSAGKALKSKKGWGGSGNTDDYGFSALPGGVRYTGGGFGSIGTGGYWWTFTEAESGNAYRRRIDRDHDDVKEYGLGKGFGFSVRCVQNKGGI
jgi:uncharacterized protein (TIGR02145 family)/uncharacterized repeat protein (TIGR02543 family)